MTQYQKYLKSWTSERGITSFLGSDKPAFQQDWKEEKKGLRFGEMESMGGEDINRAGKPFKKPKPKAKVPKYVESDLYSKETTASEIEADIINNQKEIDRIIHIKENVTPAFFRARYTDDRKMFQKRIDILRKRLKVLVG